MFYSRMLTDLHNAAPLVVPSLLSCDFAHLEDEIRRSGTLWSEDPAPGHNGRPFCAQLEHRDPGGRGHPPFHRSAPGRAPDDIRAGSVHSCIPPCGRRPVDDPHRGRAQSPPLLDEIHQIGAAAGISLNPITPVSALEGCLDLCDLVLVMSVTPGFGGQQFNPVTLEKLRQLREMADPNLLLSVDGGIQHDTISACARAGADLFVMGSALFSHHDYGRFIEEMTAMAISAKNIHV